MNHKVVSRLPVRCKPKSDHSIDQNNENEYKAPLNFTQVKSSSINSSSTSSKIHCFNNNNNIIEKEFDSYSTSKNTLSQRAGSSTPKVSGRIGRQVLLKDYNDQQQRNYYLEDKIPPPSTSGSFTSRSNPSIKHVTTTSAAAAAPLTRVRRLNLSSAKFKLNQNPIHSITTPKQSNNESITLRKTNKLSSTTTAISTESQTLSNRILILIKQIQSRHSNFENAVIKLEDLKSQVENKDKQLAEGLLLLKRYEKKTYEGIQDTTSMINRFEERNENLKKERTILTRNILHIDEDINKETDATERLGCYLKEINEKHIIAADAIPQLKQSIINLVNQAEENENKFSRELLSLERLESRCHMLTHDIRWICRVWNMSDAQPSRANIAIRILPKPTQLKKTIDNYDFSSSTAVLDSSTTKSLLNSSEKENKENTMESSTSKTLPLEDRYYEVEVIHSEFLKHYCQEHDDKNTQPQQNTNFLDRHTTAITTTSSTKNFTFAEEDKSIQLLPVTGKPFAWICLKSTKNNKFKSTQEIQCHASFSKNQSPLTHMMMVPFDKIIVNDASLKPHSLMITDWENLNISTSNTNVENTPLYPRISLLDTIEQQQTLDTCCYMIDEFLPLLSQSILQSSSSSSSSSSSFVTQPTKPIALALVSIGTHIPTTLSFWGTHQPRKICWYPSCIYGEPNKDNNNNFINALAQENPIALNNLDTESTTKENDFLQQQQPFLIGILEYAVQRVFKLKENFQQNDINLCHFDTNIKSKSEFQKWIIEGCIVMSTPDESTSVFRNTTDFDHRIHRIDNDEGGNKTLRRSVSTPLFDNEKLQKLLNEMSGLSEMNLAGIDDHTQDSHCIKIPFFNSRNNDNQIKNNTNFENASDLITLMKQSHITSEKMTQNDFTNNQNAVVTSGRNNMSLFLSSPVTTTSFQHNVCSTTKSNSTVISPQQLINGSNVNDLTQKNLLDDDGDYNNNNGLSFSDLEFKVYDTYIDLLNDARNSLQNMKAKHKGNVPIHTAVVLNIYPPKSANSITSSGDMRTNDMKPTPLTLLLMNLELSAENFQTPENKECSTTLADNFESKDLNVVEVLQHLTAFPTTGTLTSIMPSSPTFPMNAPTSRSVSRSIKRKPSHTSQTSSRQASYNNCNVSKKLGLISSATSNTIEETLSTSLINTTDSTTAIQLPSSLCMSSMGKIFSCFNHKACQSLISSKKSTLDNLTFENEANMMSLECCSRQGGCATVLTHIEQSGTSLTDLQLMCKIKETIEERANRKVKQ